MLWTIVPLLEIPTAEDVSEAFLDFWSRDQTNSLVIVGSGLVAGVIVYAVLSRFLNKSEVGEFEGSRRRNRRSVHTIDNTVEVRRQGAGPVRN